MGSNLQFSITPKILTGLPGLRSNDFYITISCRRRHRRCVPPPQPLVFGIWNLLKAGFQALGRVLSMSAEGMIVGKWDPDC